MRYAFGQYIFDPRSGELNDGQKTLQLRPQVAKLLDLLLRNANNTVSREEIKNHLWGDNIVVEFEEGISACVRQLRIALNDGAAGTRYIQTISRRGYKFVFPVSVTDADTAVPPPRPVPAPVTAPVAPGPAPAAPRRPQSGYRLAVLLAVVAAMLIAVALTWKRSGVLFQEADRNPSIVVAVLPFNNLSQNADTGVLGVSIANEVINLLGPIAPTRMGVIASTSTAHYVKGNETIRDIGQDLGANYVLEGSVSHEARTFHISARLIRVNDQSYVWGDEYDLDANYSGASYRQLVIRIATQVATLLAPDATVKPLEFTNNRDAAIAFQTGGYLINQGELDKAYGSCRKAVTLDPEFAAAYACSARALLQASVMNKSQAVEAGKLLDRALVLDPGSAEAHLLKGNLDMFYSWDLDAAGSELKNSLRLNPGDASAWQTYAEYLAAMGQNSGMQNAMETARALDPASVSVTNDQALVAYIAAQYDKAAANARINAGLNAQDEFAQHILTLSLLGAGKYAEAAKQATAEMQALQAPAADVARTKGKSHGSLVDYFTWYAGYMASKPAGKYTAVFLADAYMHLGKPDQAYAVLAAAIKQRNISTLVPFASVWPSLKPLCTRADFMSLTKQIGQVGCLSQD
ncbi:MAG: winged helix-turn-helix domain-containing tetratricopeptide repeat protein [Bacillota bacterium]